MSTVTFSRNTTLLLSDMNGEGGGAFKVETFRVGSAEVICSWRYVEGSPYFDTFDLSISAQPAKSDSDLSQDATGTAIDIILQRLAKSDNLAETALKVIIAPKGGYVCMGNILQLRFQPSDLIGTVIPFVSWDQYLPPFLLEADVSLLDWIRSSPGAVAANALHNQNHVNLDLLQEELHCRLSFDWMVSSRPYSRTVAVVGARGMNEPKRGIYWSQGYFETARALGVSMVVLENHDHWLSGPEFSHLRQKFIAVDMSDLDELPSSMAKALQGTRLDGIVTFIDDYVIATAETAELLGLPTESSQVMHGTHFKHKVRETITSDIPTIYLKTAQELLDAAHVPENIASLEYPCIVKPTRGKRSQGVQKVNNIKDLIETVRMLGQTGPADGGLLIEPYINGPELDANFAMLDGKVLFVEICDNFPCAADAQTAGLSDNFAETLQISHSALPPNEQEIICSTLHAHLLQLGFRSGVFHVEARMKNSTMHYHDNKGDGIVDLTIRDPYAQPDCFLIEVNARPPGAGGTWATYFTYGIDLGALHLLRALDDSEGFRRLSRPFSFPQGSVGGGGGAQWWTAHCMIPIPRENTYVPEDLFEQMYKLVPDIAKHVCRAELYSPAGTVVSPSGGIGWIGYLLLWSKTSRKHAIEMYNRITQAANSVLDIDVNL